MAAQCEQFLALLAELAEVSRFTDSLCSKFQMGPLELLDAYLPLLESGFVQPIHVTEPGRSFRTRLDLTQKGARHLAEVRETGRSSARAARTRAPLQPTEP